MLYHSDVAHHAQFACHVSLTAGTGVLRDTLAQTLAGVAGWTVSNHLITNILETTRSSAIHFDNYAHANPYRRPCAKARSCTISVLHMMFHPAQKAQFHPRRGRTNYRKAVREKCLKIKSNKWCFFFLISKARARSFALQYLEFANCVLYVVCMYWFVCTYQLYATINFNIIVNKDKWQVKPNSHSIARDKHMFDLYNLLYVKTKS